VICSAEQPGITTSDRVDITSAGILGGVNVRRPTLLLLALGALVMSACSTTALSSSPVETTATSVTAPPLPDTAPDVTDDTDDTDVSPVDTPVDTPVDNPVADESRPTEAEETSTTEVTTTTEETTTTIATNVVLVAEADPPIQPVGTSSGEATARAQERLLELGFWLQSVDGNYGLTTRQAVMAFQKYLGFTADGVLGPETAHYLTFITEKPRGRSDAGTMVEVDKTRQLLFFVIDGNTEWILNTSTGTEVPYERPNSNDPEIIERGSSITPTGLFDVNRQRPEGWWEGDLGEIYRPKYFVGGVAVHGSNSIPNYPASHGCVRVSVPAMDWIWESELMPLRSPVWVHGEIPTG
jgi:peptidoglycan hydrolase-like protein with peptidoglycan-binding domain